MYLLKHMSIYYIYNVRVLVYKRVYAIYVNVCTSI